MKTTLALLLACAACSSRTPPGPRAATPPAKLKPSEAGLLTIELTAAAVERLGIAFASIEQRPVARVRRLPGVFELAPDAATSLLAPFAGKVELAARPALAVGTALAPGSPVARLVPLAGPDIRTSLLNSRQAVRGRLARATADQAAARTMLSRAERLLADRVGSVRAVDEARAALAVADADHAAATGELATIDATLEAKGDAAGGAIPIVAGRSATVTAVRVFDGQRVPAGAPLVDLEDRRSLWLRVEVPQALAARLILNAPVRFGPLSLRQLDPKPAAPVAAPPRADPTVTGLLAFFSLDNTGGEHRPGERCAVAVEERGSGEPRLVAPASTLVRDAYGGAWVYRRTGPRQVRRERVEVESEQGGTVVFRRGPPAGTEVVRSGAAELFGTEFGAGK